jgi:addiction module HigA family antidote
MPTLPSTFAPIILAFAPLFFNGVWRRAQVLFLGALLAPGKRTVTSALQVMGLSHEPHFQFYHRVLNRTVWSCRRAGLILLRLLMAAFVPTGPLVLGLDDTIERRWGPKIAARGIYRDPVRSSDSHFVKTSGLRWISLMLLAPIPWAGHIWALPFLTALAPSQRYWEDRQLRPKTLIDWARQLVLQVQRWVPTRTLVLVTDGGFAALDLLTRLAGRPRPVICITRLRLDARLFRPAPRRKKGAKGRPRLVGTRLPSLQQVLTNPRTVWQRLKFRHWYGEGQRQVEIVSGTAVWYHGGRPHPGGVVLRQCIEPLGLSITDAAAALGVTRNTLSELVNGKRGISPEMAVRLSKVFGGTEEGWLVQQAQYDPYDLAQIRRDRIKLKRLEPA